MPKYYPFGRKTILLDIITLVMKFIFLDEKNHMQKTSIVEKTLNQTKHSLKKTKLDHDGKRCDKNSLSQNVYKNQMLCTYQSFIA